MIPIVERAPRLSEDIETGVQLSRMYGQQITPDVIAALFEKNKVKYVIIGCHAVNGYIARPRTTVDVDVVVQYPKKAAEVLAKAFPELTIQDTPVVTRFKQGDGKEAVDLIKAEASKLFQRLLKLTTEATVNGVSVLVPVLEGVLASKFSSMMSITRQTLDRQQDALDFARIVVANKRIDLTLVHELGEIVYPEGGKQMVELIGDARASRTLRV